MLEALSQFSNNQTNYNNGSIVGDVGIGSPHQFTISNANLNGNIRFSGAASTSGLSGGPAAGSYSVSGGGTFTGVIVANDAAVSAAISSVNSLSQTLGGQMGTHISVTGGGSINASAGNLVSGNRIFTVDAVSFPNGTFTINGSASDMVVLNVGFSANFHGVIQLAGGITADDVLVNVFGGDYTTHTGGPTLDVNTNGLVTMGIFLDPNGQMSLTHSTLDGRFFGGDVQNQQIVSGANINMPAIVAPVPVPASLVLAATGIVPLTIGAWRRRRVGMDH
jgi:hypothetical protein